MTADATLPPEQSPNRYIEKVRLATGEVVDEPIVPRQLLVHSHRDYHIVDVQARRFMSRIVGQTGDEELARQKMKEVRELGHRAAEVVAKTIRADPEVVSKRLFGLKEKEYYFRYKTLPYSAEQIADAIERLRSQAREQFDAATVDGVPALRVLLTGGTGFVGKEIMWQVAQNAAVSEMVVLIRPKTIRDRKTGEVTKVLSPAERGADLLRQLWLDEPGLREKFRFIAGDVEEPNMGIDEDELAGLRTSLTHVIHCAASVAFDDPYEASFQANVTGTLNALRFSLSLQSTEGSPFVSHLGIETSYIHGRATNQSASEDEIVFPRNFYNNFYELTKAMASIETERFMLEKGLRVVQLCPAIVIGESRAGNNRGDTKVVNAPVNVFGRAHEALSDKKGNWYERSSTAMLARMACIFPGDPSAEINLIPVDRVVEGIVAALTKPDAVGERVHLATDNRVTSEAIQQTVQEEVGVRVRLAEPTLHRNVTLPVLTKVLGRFKQDRMANALDKLGTIFGGYSEWGQPVHEVGKDVSVLGLSDQRPNALDCFRMLCRHNRYVQEFSKVRDLDEISRREKVWWELMHDLEVETGGPVAKMSAVDFRKAILEHLDLETFTRRERSKAPQDDPTAATNEGPEVRSRARFAVAAPQLRVADVVASARHYRDVLGFQVAGTYGDPPFFAVVRRGEAEIQIGDLDPGATPPASNRAAKAISYDLYIYVDDVDRLGEEFSASGAEIVEGPVDRPYEKRELVVRDLDGYVLAFGQDLPT